MRSQTVFLTLFVFGLFVFPSVPLHTQTVALYFSAMWCPPCRGFTPMLRSYYAQAVVWSLRQSTPRGHTCSMHACHTYLCECTPTSALPALRPLPSLLSLPFETMIFLVRHFLLACVCPPTLTPRGTAFFCRPWDQPTVREGA